MFSIEDSFVVAIHDLDQVEGFIALPVQINCLVGMPRPGQVGDAVWLQDVVHTKVGVSHVGRVT